MQTIEFTRIASPALISAVAPVAASARARAAARP